MSVLFRLARRYISRRFLQSTLFIFGVALGVSMVIAIDIANSSSKRAFNLSTESLTGKATHQIIAGPGGMSSEIYRQIRVDLGIRTSAPIVTEYVTGEGLGAQPLRLLGVDPFAEPPFRTYLASINVDGQQRLSFDALTAFIASPNTVLISENLAARFGVQTGGTITLTTGIRSVEVRIVGILQPSDKVSAQALDDLILSDISTAQAVAGSQGRLSRIDLILPADNTAIAEQIRVLLPSGVRFGTVGETNSTLDQMTAAFELNLQALSLLALVVGLFLIYNTVTFSVVQRRPILGIMRSVGASQQQIFTLIIGEALLLGSIGTIFGLGLGILFGRASVGLVAQTISDLYFTVNVQGISVEAFTLIKGAAVGIFASVIAAVIPAYDATRTAPAGIMRRSEQEESIRRFVPALTGLAIAVNLVGLLLLQIPTQSVVVSFAALFCIVVGSAFFTPGALVLMMRLITPVTTRLFGVVGRMAPRAVVRSLSRTSVAVAALTIAVSVIVGVSVMISSFRTTVADWLQTTLGADIFVSTPLLTTNQSTADIDPIIKQLVADTPGVREVSAARQVSVVAPDYPDLPPVNMSAVDFDISVKRNFVWNSVPEGDYKTAMTNGAVIVSEPFAFRRHITRDNAEITLLTDQGEQTFLIVGVYYDYTTDQGNIVMFRNVYDQYWDDPFISSVAAYITEDADLDAVVTKLRSDVLREYDLQIQPNRDLRSGVFKVFDNAFAITIALRLLATLVAFIGILSALLSLQLENTRQYGLMRATGMTPRQLWDFTLVQTGLMGLVAGVLAMPIGLALALVLLYVINVRSFGWTMQFYWIPSEFAVAFAVAVVAALAAGVYPAWRLTRLIVARALRSE